MPQAFGDCVFDRGRRELTRHGSPVHGAPKLFALLELLLDAAPRAVTKGEIHKAIWPETFVSDATLTSLVAELRAAIGDDARAPTLVRTIHGYGYGFVGEIHERQAQETRSMRLILGDREIALTRGTHILGRAPDAAVCVNDSGVSRHHAKIIVGPEGATLEDLGSKNGTFVEDQRIDGVRSLRDGDVIRVGSVKLTLRRLIAPGSTETEGR